MPSPSSTVKLARAIIAACGLAAVYALLRSARGNRLRARENADVDDNLEYPKIRAHVYYASPENSFKTALDAIASLPNFRTASIDESNLCLVAEAQVSDAAVPYEMALKALPLGPRHTRIVIRPLAAGKHPGPPKNTSPIRAIQDMMDQKLTGG